VTTSQQQLGNALRDEQHVAALVAAIRDAARRSWRIMEVCGGQTHAIVRFGLDELLPPQIELLHGPGCPVCVTPIELIDRAQSIAALPGATLCTFGDMLRVPGSRGDLFGVKARGGDVRVVYSPLDAVEIASREPGREVVFFAVGFETTAPANAMAVLAARSRGLENFSILSSHVLVPPALAVILQDEAHRVDAFLGPGHVCTIMGLGEYEALVRAHHVPIVVAGFEPVDLLAGVLAAVRQLEAGEARVEVAYGRAVSREGNARARASVAEVFEPCDRGWRGIGTIPVRGLRVRPELRAFDAEHRFDVSAVRAAESEICISGRVLMGRAKPADCPAFGRACTPESPLGATMVSAEGACAAYHRYRGVRPGVS
jgi:hydrogenase expression/formation protein HypD